MIFLDKIKSNDLFSLSLIKRERTIEFGKIVIYLKAYLETNGNLTCLSSLYTYCFLSEGSCLTQAMQA